MLKRLRKRTSGFTLVELMIVVAIIGILAAIAIPAFSRYIKRSRTAEAVGHLNKLWAGSVTYYEADHMDTNIPANALPKQFPGPSGADENAAHCGCLTGAKCPGAATVWSSDKVWLSLNFALPDPHAYKPGYTGAGTGTAAQFTAVALGDLDCDGTVALFSRRGNINANGDVTGGTAPNISDELE